MSWTSDSTDPLAAFRRGQCRTGTLNLARQAAANRGVRRFIFVSSVKVNGEMTAERDQPFEPTDGSFIPSPTRMVYLNMRLSKVCWNWPSKRRMEVVIVSGRHWYMDRV